MLYVDDLTKILFLDIETVRQKKSWDELDHDWQELWDHKTRFQREESVSPEDFYAERAGILAEFGKIVCISVGVFYFKDNQRRFKIKSFYGDDEKVLLQDFAELLNKSFYTAGHKLCAHNGKEFDFPYIARRMVINGVTLPSLLNTYGKKPWEVQHLDTMELWKFGDWKNYTSLKLLTKCLGIPSPKDDIDGSQVGQVYWEENDLKRIVTYCQKDTLTVAQLVLRYMMTPLLTEDQIEEVPVS
ncbi:MAG: 3'-5' exonuclease [Schleiferiaceae bacterium]|nr:3'-5' exonuclease [Schleiferiaceae bacterium]